MKSFNTMAMLLCCIVSWSCNSVLGVNDFKSPTCREGETQCKNNISRQCVGGLWIEKPCEHQTCNAEAGSCAGICAPGEKSCAANTTQACSAIGTWIDEQACTKQTCNDGECVGECEPGEVSCSSDQRAMRSCNKNGLWEIAEICQDRTCNDGTCVGECAPGKRCKGNTPQTCNAFGEWVSEATCSAGQVCSGGSCTCIQGDLRCYENQPQKCDESNQWVNSGPACMDQSCDPDQAACVGECEQGERRCVDQTAVQNCNLKGMWETNQTCSALGCFEGQCAACEPEEKRCSGLTPQLCGADRQWDDAAACNDQTTCVSGVCAGECAVTAARCAGNWPQVCDPSGIWQYAANPCAEGENCHQGACIVQCAPESRRCAGDFPQICDISGKWQSAGPACGQCIACSPNTGLCAPEIECSEVQAIATGAYHACALLSTGKVKCWGANSLGNLGLGDKVGRGESPGEMGPLLPIVDLGANMTVVAVAVGGRHSCALSTEGKVKCWGYNAQGQLGQGHDVSLGDDANEMGDQLPFIDLGSNEIAIEISAGRLHTCALLSDGTVKCWGSNAYGQCGFGNSKSRGARPDDMGDDLPVVDLGSGVTATAIRAGGDHTCALLSDRRVKCWGRNEYGELGLGDKNSRGDNVGEMGENLPAVDLGPGLLAKAISTGEQHACAIFDNGSVKCWGRSNSGQIGIGAFSNRGDEPGEMGALLPAVNLGLGAQAVGINAGGTHTCALLSNANVKCWGSNITGQLGLGDTNVRGDQPNEMGASLPTVNLGLAAKVKAVSGGGDDTGIAFTCALLIGGSVKCWGSAGLGQIGLSDTLSRGDQPNEMGDNLATIDL